MSPLPVDIWDQSAKYFPDLGVEGVWEATAEHWEFSGGVPLYKDWGVCPFGHAVLQPRWWRWHVRKGGTNPNASIPYRCDFSAKCTDCGLLFYFGIALTKDQWEERPWPNYDRDYVSWRTVREYFGRLGGHYD